MARVALLCPDLLFGSKIEGGLRAAGHEVVRADAHADVLVVDLNADGVDPAAIDSSMRRLGFYAHTDVDTKRRAQEAGFDLVVPRSRMAREMAALVERLAK
jgi:hypothetical protein